MKAKIVKSGKPGTLGKRSTAVSYSPGREKMGNVWRNVVGYGRK